MKSLPGYFKALINKNNTPSFLFYHPTKFDCPPFLFFIDEILLILNKITPNNKFSKRKFKKLLIISTNSFLFKLYTYIITKYVYYENISYFIWISF